MKNSMKSISLSVAILLAASFSAFSADKEAKKATAFGTGIYKTIDGKINVMVDKKLVNAPTQLIIKNEKNEIIYKEVVSGSLIKFGRSLNLGHLDVGRYLIEVSSKGEMQTQQFEVEQVISNRTVVLE